MGEKIALEKKEFLEMLKLNQSTIVLKLGADWCGPCKKIEPIVDEYFDNCPSPVACYKVDVDESFNLFGMLKTKRVLNGIPALLAYNKDNESVMPDDSCLSSNETEVKAFFDRVYKN